VTTFDLTGRRLDLKVRAGDDPAWTVNTSTDLSGWTWRGQIRETAGAPDVLGEFVFTVDASSATIQIPITVSSVLPRSTVYDVKVFQGGTDAHTLLSGKITTEASVTR
jgi:hypothetical protein